MLDVLQVARWFCVRYFDCYKTTIDEMKLHKLLYLAQRESFVRRGVPMFADSFRAWKYGPVLTNVRAAFHDGRLCETISPLPEFQQSDEGILMYVFNTYAAKGSWSLSRLTHSETSWKNARGNLEDWERGDGVIAMSDIRIDAERVANRRVALSKMGIACA